jgi:hypothetical protein
MDTERVARRTRRRPVPTALLALAWPAAALAGAPAVTGFDLSFDQAYPSSNGLIADEELALASPAGGLTRIDLGLAPELDLAAFHRRSDGAILFTLEQPALLPGGLFALPGKIVSYSPEFGYEPHFGVSAVGIEVGIDALSWDETTGLLYLSFDVDVDLGTAGIAHPHDVVRVLSDPFTFTVLFSGCDEGVPPGVDVDAIHWDPEGERLYLSFDSSTAAGQPIAADDEDVVSWTAAGGFAMALDLSAVDDELAAFDTDALNVRFATDPWLFADGFESGDTSAWSGEVP